MIMGTSDHCKFFVNIGKLEENTILFIVQYVHIECFYGEVSIFVHVD